MLEPENNPNSVLMVDPPRILRWLMSKVMGRVASTKQISKRRRRFEAQRAAQKRGHEVEYFHQLDDPYSHLMAQVLAQLAERYDINVLPRLIRTTGGKHQPESKKLAAWARRDAALVAPHFGLTYPDAAGVTPLFEVLQIATRALANCDPAAFIANVKAISQDLWSGAGDLKALADVDLATEAEANTALDEGSARLSELNHYSGASLY